MIDAKIICDSINPAGNRLTTVQCTFPRWILAEVNTHRMLSRNSASSRAIPINKIISQVFSTPAQPVSWGANRSGMQSKNNLSGIRLFLAKRLFLFARYPAILFAFLLSKVGLHKQVTNRILEPWIWHTAILSATEWDNFFKLRLHPAAQPEFQDLAKRIKSVMDSNIPVALNWGEWHLPYSDYNVIAPDNDTRRTVSVARCARVSYVRQNEIRSIESDSKFTNMLSTNGHWSPFEHVAVAENTDLNTGNFRGWKQYRKFFNGESGAENINNKKMDDFYNE